MMINMKLLTLTLLLTAPTPPGFLLLTFLFFFFIIHSVLKEIYHAHQ